MSRSLLILTHEFAPITGGAATYTREIACAAVDAGHTVEVWAPANPRAADAAHPFTVRRLPMKANQNWPGRLVLLRALREARIDWTHTTLYLPEPGPMRLWIYDGLWQLPQPRERVVTLHGSEILRFAHWPHRRAGFGRMLAKANRIGVVSNPVRDLLLQYFPAAQDRVVVVPGALPREFSTPPASPPRTEGKLRVLTVGRIHPRKGQLEVLRALAALPESLKERIVYQLAGPTRRPRYAEQLRQYAAANGIALEGPAEIPEAALPATFAAADLFVMASKPEGASIEGFGLVYIEAAHCGVPVIGVNTGGVADAIGPDNGLLVPPGDRPALTAAIHRLLTASDLRQRLGAAGREWSRRFSWERNVAALFPPQDGD